MADIIRLTKPLINAQDQIMLLKSSGVRFELADYTMATDYLVNKTFFFKIKALCKNFDKYSSSTSPNFGKYIDLDFGYLIELSKLDRDLRFFVIHAALDIEHFLKVQINRSLMENSVDAYKIVEDFFDFDAARKKKIIAKSLNGEGKQKVLISAANQINFVLGNYQESDSDCEADVETLYVIWQNLGTLLDNMDIHHIERSINQLETSSYSHNLAVKYGRRGNMAYWNYLELATFGDIIAFYKYLFFEIGIAANSVSKQIKPLLFPAKTLRNAAAHNSNLLGGLRNKSKKSVGKIAELLKIQYGIDSNLVDKTRRVPVIHDFSALMLTYDAVVSAGSTKKNCGAKLKAIAARLTKNIDMFAKQPEIYDCLSCLAAICDAMADRYSHKINPSEVF